MADVEEAFRIAESLSPAERLSLIAQLWASLPPENWPNSTDEQLAEANRLLATQNVAKGENVPRTVVEHLLADCVRSSRPKVYGARRRFDLASVFVITTAYAILFAILAALQLPPYIILMSAGFIAIVAVGQSILFRGLKPRSASIFVGAAAYFVISVGSYLWNPRMYPASMLLTMLLYGSVWGCMLGYLTGTLVGGVFLIADFARRRLSRSNSVPPAPADESPFGSS